MHSVRSHASSHWKQQLNTSTFSGAPNRVLGLGLGLRGLLGSPALHLRGAPASSAAVLRGPVVTRGDPR